MINSVSVIPFTDLTEWIRKIPEMKYYDSSYLISIIIIIHSAIVSTNTHKKKAN